jgi:hypothetical protein
MPSSTKEVSKKNNDLKKAKIIDDTKKIKSKKNPTKKVAQKQTTTTSKKTNTKSTNKKNSTKSMVKKESSTKTTAKKVSTKNTRTATQKANPPAEVVEYYDLPYRYNETIVKILYQTPDTLFVYWDISDQDRENYIKNYGENFFNITRPVLIVHNDTMNYSFEIPINDFANSWYLHINDSKCNYRVELGRRPNYYNKEAKKEIQENIHTDYIYVSASNKIESPNDHVLFNTNENNTVKFRNIKDYTEKSVSLYDIIKRLPATKKSSNIPYISNELLKTIYAGIYENKDISLFDKISNPSSGNPTSGSMPSSRF